MEFRVYMLECIDETIYTGHTDDIDVRIRSHFIGTFKGYTSRHPPRRLIYAESLPTRDEAFFAERRIKGWSRAKKLSLACGDWAEIIRLARTSGRVPEFLRYADVPTIEMELPTAAHCFDSLNMSGRGPRCGQRSSARIGTAGRRSLFRFLNVSGTGRFGGSQALVAFRRSVAAGVGAVGIQADATADEVGDE